MSFTSLSVIILVIIGLTVFRYARREYKKGLSHSLISLCVILFAALVGAFASTLFVGAFFDSVIKLLSEYEFYGEFIELLAGFEEVLFLVVKMLLSLVLYIPTFYILRLLLNIPIAIIMRRMTAKKDKDNVEYYKENEEFYVKNNKIIASFIGAVTGFVISVIVFTPISGVVRTAASAIDFAEEKMEEEILEEEVLEAFEYLSDDFSLSLVAACGGEMLFDFSTAIKVDGESTCLSKELEAIYSIDFDAFAELVAFEGTAQENAERIRQISEQIQKSKILKVMFVETVSGLSEAWLKYEDYMGAERPQFGESGAVDGFIDELLYVCRGTDSQTIADDVNTLINISSMLMDEVELLSSGDYDAVIGALVDGGIIDRVKTELGKNKRMSSVVAAVDNLIMGVIAEEIQDYTKYSVEECEDFFYEVSDILTSTSGLSGDVRVSAVTNSIKEVFEGYGIDGMYVPESLTEDVASKLIEDIDSFGGEVTFDDVKDYFEEYINDGGDIFDDLPQE